MTLFSASTLRRHGHGILFILVLFFSVATLPSASYAQEPESLAAKIAGAENEVRSLEKAVELYERLANSGDQPSNVTEAAKAVLAWQKPELKAARDALAELRSKSPQTKRLTARPDSNVTATDVESNNSEAAKIKNTGLELTFVGPDSAAQAALSGTHFYPQNSSNALIYEIRNKGDEPLQEVAFRFVPSQGKIPKIAGDSDNCAIVAQQRSVDCGFVELTPGQTKRIQIYLDLRDDVTFRKDHGYVQNIQLMASVRADDVKPAKADLVVPLRDCASLFKDALRTNADALSKLYQISTEEPLASISTYPKQIRWPHAATKGKQLGTVIQLTKEMVGNQGRDRYLATGGAAAGGNSLAKLMSEYPARIMRNMKPGGICHNPRSEVAEPVVRFNEAKRRAQQIKVHAERTGRQARRWRDAVSGAISELGTKTGPMGQMKSGEQDGVKAFITKGSTFFLGRGFVNLLILEGVGTMQVAATRRTLGVISLFLSAKDIVKADWDAAKAAGIVRFDIEPALAMIESAAHLGVLSARYAAFNEANETMLYSLDGLYQSSCTCRYPFE